MNCGYLAGRGHIEHLYLKLDTIAIILHVEAVLFILKSIKHFKIG